MATKMTVQEARAFFAKVNEADGLPAAMADAGSVLAATQALQTSGIADAFDKFLEWQGKRDAAQKSQGKAIGRKTECPLTHAELESFAESGESVDINMFGTVVTCTARRFNTGSYGFSGTGKAKLNIAGKSVTLQLTPNFAIVGSGMVK